MEHSILLAAVPALVIAAFTVHWITIMRIRSSEERLPRCRGAYLGLSIQLVLYGWLVYLLYGRAHPALALVPLGMTFSSAGDLCNLQFDPIRRMTGEPLFYGILCFMAAQICYIAGFLSMIPVAQLASRGYLYPLLALLIFVPAVLFRFRVYNPERPKSIMAGALIYGAILGSMAAVALSAAWVFGGPWRIIAAGALFFLLSDAIMGETTIHGRHPVTEYQVPWITYLAAQGLILYGFAMALA
ncbi:MAG: hypothetical protein JXA20_12175 [Spirochaetes bacterium]|nr:hypothetical protein [Spirochaetota bacterium]